MCSFTSKKYDIAKKWIHEKKEEGFDWDSIKNCCVSSETVESRFQNLKIPEMVVPQDMSLEDWRLLVEDISSKYIDISKSDISGIYTNTADFSFDVPTESQSAWVLYEKKLRGESGGKPVMSNESVNIIKEYSHWILNRIRKDTTESGPQKGLVVGSVQSGKTSNMVGLVTMAAHYDWNFVIILTGSIENLRVQTRNRFMDELVRSVDVDWHFLESASNEDYLNDISTEKTITLRDAKLNFSEQNTIGRSPNHETYVAICLKQASRLKKLIHWLNSDANIAKRIRLLIIDDEADQASINTAKMSDEQIIKRTAINQYIIDLANGQKEDHSAGSPFQAINYIAYTATPYANVLNEKYKESLYPKDFIACLPENKSYIGSKIIWGSKRDGIHEGLGIERLVSDNSSNAIRAIGEGSKRELPCEFKKSVAWFLCCVAALRRKNWKKNISMLIHTSVKNGSHLNLYNSLCEWFSNDAKNGVLLSLCKTVYTEETKAFGYKKFSENYPDYEALSNVDTEYPSFEDIREELNLIIQSQLKKIEISSAGEYDYSEDGIHVCIDDCKAEKYTDNDTQLRIIYPDKAKLESLNKAPAFIVIGGNTLSRGLTIEGLVCTFFTRNTSQADTLMQMARWYGYRHGYELYPRLWMTNINIMKYKVLSEVDEKLRKTLSDYKEMGKDPSKISPVIMSTSSIARFDLTSKNKRQHMIPYSMDYSGDSYELTDYPADSSKLLENLKNTELLLQKLGTPDKSKVYSDRSAIWYGVDSNTVIDFLKSFNIYRLCNFANQMNDFFIWMEKENIKGNYLNWNVAVCGSSKHKGAKWSISGIDVPLGKVERTKLKRVTSHIDIGSMRSGRDGICDIDTDNCKNPSLIAKGRTGKDIEIIRGKLGYADTPLLLLYCIDKDGGAETETKSKLETDTDLIGFSVIIGGDPSNSDHVESVTVQSAFSEDEDETEE